MKTIYLLLIILTLSFCKQNKEEGAHFNHTAIYVMNLEKSAEFYKTVFNFEKQKDPFNDGKHYWFKTDKNRSLHIIAGADSVRSYNINEHTCYAVPNLDEFIAKLKTINWEYYNYLGKVGEITKRDDGVLQIYLKDPDGYWIEVNNVKD